MTEKLEKGYKDEYDAKKYLIEHGLIWLASNYRCRVGEIDLVMETSLGTLVFVEVRKRTSAAFGGAAASVTRSKQKKIMKTAHYYLMTHPHHGHHGIRFDVLAFDGSPPRITWIKQAFEE